MQYAVDSGLVKALGPRDSQPQNELCCEAVHVSFSEVAVHRSAKRKGQVLGKGNVQLQRLVWKTEVSNCSR